MGKPLSEELIKQKTRQDSLGLIRNLNLWGMDIDDLKVLRIMPNLEVLSLSVNKISTLRDISQCLKLKELYLRKNFIADIQEIRFLGNLPELKVLWLSDNPCANVQFYREIVIKALPNLEKLDNMNITQEDRQAAAGAKIDFMNIMNQQYDGIGNQQNGNANYEQQYNNNNNNNYGQENNINNNNNNYNNIQEKQSQSQQQQIPAYTSSNNNANNNINNINGASQNSLRNSALGGVSTVYSQRGATSSAQRGANTGYDEVQQMDMGRSELDTDLEELERQIENELLSLQTYDDERLLTSQVLTPQTTTTTKMLPVGGYQQMNSKQLETINQQIWQHQLNQQSQQVNSQQNQKHQRANEIYPKYTKEQKQQQQPGAQSIQQSQQQQQMRDSSFNKLKEKNKNLFTIEDLSTEERKQTTMKRNTQNTQGKKTNNNSIVSGIVQSSKSPKGKRQGKENNPPVKKMNGNNQNNNSIKETKERIDSQSDQNEQGVYQNHNNLANYQFNQPQQLMQHPYQQLLLPFSFNGNNNNTNVINDLNERINNIDYVDGSNDISSATSNTVPSSSTVGLQMSKSQSNSQLIQSKYLQKNKSYLNKDSCSQSQQSSNQQYTFKPMLSKKSMQMAEKMEDARVRLVTSKEKQIEKVERLREELDNRYSFKPAINSNYGNDRKDKNKRRDGQEDYDEDEENCMHQESVFNYSDDEDDNDDQNNRNHYQNSHNTQNNHGNNKNNKNNGRASSSSSSQVAPRWEYLYERHKAQQIEREMRIIDKERAQNEDPELTFQPVLFKPNQHNYMYADSEFDVAKRSEMWQLKKLDKLKRIKEEFNKKNLESCTFHPNRVQVQQSKDNEGTTSRTSRSSNRGEVSNNNGSIPGNRQQQGVVMNSNEYFSNQLSEFSKQGMIEYFERVDLAKRLKQEAEQQQNKPLGVNWQNKVTVPKEFSFMKKNNLEWLESVNSQTSNGSRQNNSNGSGVVVGPLPKAPRMIVHSNSQSSLEHSKMRNISQRNNIQRTDGNYEKVNSNSNSNHDSLQGNNQDKHLNKVKDSLHKHLHSLEM